MDYSAFAQGWEEKGDKNRQSRLDNLKLWSEYKKANPYASLEELQAYRDSLAGGSNYLGKVLPTSTVLQTLADRNRSNYDQAMLERTYGNMEARAKVMGTMQADIDNAIMQSGGTNLAGAAQDFLARYPELQSTPDIAKRIVGQFSEGRFNALKVKSIEESMPTVTRLIASNPNMTADELAAATNLPKGIAKGAMTQAQEALRQKNYDWYARHNDRIIDRAVDLAKDGMDISKSLEQSIAEIDPSKKVDESKDIISKYVSIVQQKAKQVQDDRQRDINDRASREFTDLQEFALKSSQIRRAIQYNDFDQARAALENLIKRRVPTDLQDSFERAEIDEILDYVGTELSQVREDQMMQLREKNKETAGAARKADISADTKLIERYYGKGKNFTPNAQVGPDRQINGNTAIAASQLAQQYDLNPYNLDAITRAWQAAPNLDGTSQVQDLVAAALPALQRMGVGTRANQTSSIDFQTELRSGLAFNRPRTYEEVRDQQMDAATTRIDLASNYADQIGFALDKIDYADRTVEDYERAISHMEQLKDKINRESQAWRESNDYLERYRMRWEKISRDSKGWDSAEMRALENDENNAKEKFFRDDIDFSIDLYKREIEKLKRQAPKTVPQKGDIQSTTGSTSPVGRAVSNFFDAQSAGQAINSALDPIRRQSAWLGQMVYDQTDAELAAKQKLLKFVENAGGHQSIANRIFANFGPKAQNGSTQKANAKVQEFIADPTKFMRENQAWLEDK